MGSGNKLGKNNESEQKWKRPRFEHVATLNSRESKKRNFIQS